LQTGVTISAREESMQQKAKIEVIIDPSLLNHFTENLSKQGSSVLPDEAITGLITTILDGSEFPISATQTGSGEIRIAYHLRSFSQPFFE
jgi:hypothetical protein